MNRIMLLVLCLGLLFCGGCGLAIGKLVHRAYAKDDVVLVKKPEAEPNKVYKRFVIRKKFKILPVMAAPEELLAEETGMLTSFNDKVKAEEVVVYGNYDQFEQSPEAAEKDYTLGAELSEWLKTRKKRQTLAARMSKRATEDSKWGHHF